MFSLVSCGFIRVVWFLHYIVTPRAQAVVCKFRRVQTLLRTYTHPERLPSGDLPGPPVGPLEFRPLVIKVPIRNFQDSFIFLVSLSQWTVGTPGSNISTTRGRPDTRFCVCENPRGELSHITSLTPGCSRSEFFRIIRRAQDHTCWGTTDTGHL